MEVKNTAKIIIENCLNCPYHYCESILTADSWEHETGCYCKKVEDKSTDSWGSNGKHRLVGSDDWHLELYTKIPDWCPYCDREIVSTVDK